MKKILILPVASQGVVDVRALEYYIIEDIQFLEQITGFLVKKAKKTADYKYCQFEASEMIPFFIKIKDKLSSGLVEFEASKVTFDEIPHGADTKKALIEERHLKPLDNQMRELIYNTTYHLASERLGCDVDEDEFINLRIQKDELDDKIKKFDYKKFLTEIV